MWCDFCVATVLVVKFSFCFRSIFSFFDHDFDDDILVGWAVSEFYDIDFIFSGTVATFYYDIDGELVDTIDFDYSVLINTEVIDAAGLQAKKDFARMVKFKARSYQIKKITAATAQAVAKLAHFYLSGQFPDFEASILGKAAKKSAISILKKRLKKLLQKKLIQIHHVIPQKFFNKDYKNFFKSIGFNKDDFKNIMALPTKKGKAAGVQGQRVLSCCIGKDLQQVVFIPAAYSAFHHLALF